LTLFGYAPNAKRKREAKGIPTQNIVELSGYRLDGFRSHRILIYTTIPASDAIARSTAGSIIYGGVIRKIPESQVTVTASKGPHA